MSFIWPGMLWSLLAVPLLVWGYIRLDGWRTARQVELGTMGTAVAPSGRALGWRRHVPAAVFLVGVTVLLFALARPVATVDLPRREGTVILAFDVSNSMLADDFDPTRLRAAQRAARTFVDAQPETVDIGVVTFSTAAFEVLPPTESRGEVKDAIRRISAEGGTSLGQGIGAALNAIAGEPIIAGVELPIRQQAPDAIVDESPSAEVPSVPFLGSAAIVLLSDGEDTTAVDPVALADVAGRAGVRVFPIGIGSPEGTVVDVDGFSVSTALNEELLRQVATASNGEYYQAGDADALEAVYESIDLRFTVEGEETEITALLAAGALVVFLVAAVLSVIWLGRVP